MHTPIAAPREVDGGRIATVGLFSAAYRYRLNTHFPDFVATPRLELRAVSRFRELGTTRALQSMGPGRSLQPSQGQAAVSGVGRPQQRGLAAAVPLSLPRRLTWILTPRCSVSKARQQGGRGRGTAMLRSGVCQRRAKCSPSQQV